MFTEVTASAPAICKHGFWKSNFIVKKAGGQRLSHVIKVAVTSTDTFTLCTCYYSAPKRTQFWKPCLKCITWPKPRGSFTHSLLGSFLPKKTPETTQPKRWRAGLEFSFSRFGCMVGSVTLGSNLGKSWHVLGEATHLMVARKQAREGEETNKGNP